MARASLQAGLAFTNALLGATHAIAHQIGGALDLPHGLLNAILMPHVMRFNAETHASRYVDVARALGVPMAALTPAAAAEAAIDRVEALTRALDIPGGLRVMGVDPADFGRFAVNALGDAYITTNPGPSPRPMSATSASPPTERDQALERLIGVRCPSRASTPPGATTLSASTTHRDARADLHRAVRGVRGSERPVRRGRRGRRLPLRRAVGGDHVRRTSPGQDARASSARARGGGDAPRRPQPVLDLAADRALTAERPVMVEEDELGEAYELRARRRRLRCRARQLAGMLVVGLGDDAEVAPSDISIWSRSQTTRASPCTTPRCSSRTSRRRLEQAGRRQL